MLSKPSSSPSCLRVPHLDSIVLDSHVFCNSGSDVKFAAPFLFRMAASTRCLPDAAVPQVTLFHHLNLVCFIDVILDFMLSLILYRFLLKFLLLLAANLVRVCCQLPSCSVVPLPLSLPEKRLCTPAAVIFLSSVVSDVQHRSKFPLTS